MSERSEREQMASQRAVWHCPALPGSLGPWRGAGLSLAQELPSGPRCQVCHQVDRLA